MKATNIEWDFDGEDLTEEEKECLPTEIELPDEIEVDDYDAIDDYLSEQTGFCHKGYVLKNSDK